MQPSIRDNYLETEVMTASPQKLQYMLIDAAVRNLQRAKHLWSESQNDEACEAVIRAQAIITQILSGLNRDVDANLTRKVASVYMFVFRALNEVQLKREEAKIDECIRVLEVERETWRLLCEQIEQEQGTENAAVQATLASQMPQPDSPPTAPAGPPTPKMPALDLSSDLASGEEASAGFSIEA